MLSFNPILSQSRAMQNLKNPQLCWCSQMSYQVLFPYLQYCSMSKKRLDPALVVSGTMPKQNVVSVFHVYNPS